ncbi:hypothetical protein JUJ52_19330 [Virgibacillus sp. AGTR]|uniref:hypothetical protein n=1 Tax=Virgibacillus sp. AGTR TaxID=2812055 RepID=UPI001D1643AE|nr:hypothetical protein [Virgibacillus sp. AGTR]MCC2252088.1 hypothetical protein [Virgibacillus sp. AGTR]
MSRKNYLITYAFLFVVFYLAVMLFKYETNDNLDWLKTFLFMFCISFIYLLLRQTKKK